MDFRPFLALALLVATSPSMADSISPTEPVDAAIVLAVDVSNSVSNSEYQLQRQGIANALRDPDVGRMLEQCNANGVALTFVEWAGFDFRKRLNHELNWRKLTTAADLQEFANEIDKPRKRSTDGNTDIINALRFSMQLLSSVPFESRRKIISISGDGGQNVSPPGEQKYLEKDEQIQALRIQRDVIVSLGMVIDALVIPTDDDERRRIGPLDEYFKNNVIGGRGSNMRTVNDRAEYANGLKVNLMSELNNCMF